MIEFVLILVVAGLILHITTSQRIARVVSRAIEAWEKRNRPVFPEEVSAEDLTEEQADRILAEDRWTLEEFEAEIAEETGNEDILTARNQFVQQFIQHLQVATCDGTLEWKSHDTTNTSFRSDLDVANRRFHVFLGLTKLVISQTSQGIRFEVGIDDFPAIEKLYQEVKTTVESGASSQTFVRLAEELQEKT